MIHSCCFYIIDTNSIVWWLKGIRLPLETHWIQSPNVHSLCIAILEQGVQTLPALCWHLGLSEFIVSLFALKSICDQTALLSFIPLLVIQTCFTPMVYFDCSTAGIGSNGVECQKSCNTLDMACVWTTQKKHAFTHIYLDTHTENKC